MQRSLDGAFHVHINDLDLGPAVYGIPEVWKYGSMELQTSRCILLCGAVENEMSVLVFSIRECLQCWISMATPAVSRLLAVTGEILNPTGTLALQDQKYANGHVTGM